MWGNRRARPLRPTGAGPMRRRRPRPLGIRYGITGRAGKRTEPVDELRDISQCVHMRIRTIQFRAPCPGHAFRFRELHKVVDLVAVAFPPVKSSAVKSDNTGEQGIGRLRMSARLKYNDGVGRAARGDCNVGSALTFLHMVRTCFAPRVGVGECPRR